MSERCPNCDRHYTNSGACPDDWHTKYLEAEECFGDAKVLMEVKRLLNKWADKTTDTQTGKPE